VFIILFPHPELEIFKTKAANEKANTNMHDVSKSESNSNYSNGSKVVCADMFSLCLLKAFTIRVLDVPNVLKKQITKSALSGQVRGKEKTNI